MQVHDGERGWGERISVETGAVLVRVRRYDSSECGHERTKRAMLTVMPHPLHRRGFMLEE